MGQTDRDGHQTAALCSSLLWLRPCSIDKIKLVRKVESHSSTASMCAPIDKISTESASCGFSETAGLLHVLFIILL